MHTPIVIIGAGPAGAMAALEVARGHVPVTLLNRDRFPGEHNVCGGALAMSAKSRLALPDAVIDREVSSITLYYRRYSCSITSRSPQFISVRRPVFDRYLAEQAVAAGAQLLNDVHVTHVDSAAGVVYAQQNGVPLVYQAQLVIFADGPNTLAHRCCGIGFHSGQHYFVAIHYDVAAPEATDRFPGFSFYLEQENLATGYYWIFPKLEVLNVGVGSYYQPAAKIAYGAALDSFVRDRLDLPGVEIRAKQGGVIPAVPARHFVGERSLVIGDAAGLVNPLTGGGLIHALKSGEIAGRVAVEAYGAGEYGRGFLRRYDWRLRCTPHYIWIRFLYPFARYHLYRAQRRQGASLDTLLKAYFLMMRAVMPRLRL